MQAYLLFPLYSLTHSALIIFSPWRQDAIDKRTSTPEQKIYITSCQSVDCAPRSSQPLLMRILSIANPFHSRNFHCPLHETAKVEMRISAGICLQSQTAALKQVESSRPCPIERLEVVLHGVGVRGQIGKGWQGCLEFGNGVQAVA
jgi:hypothetical protein